MKTSLYLTAALLSGAMYASSDAQAFLGFDWDGDAGLASSTAASAQMGNSNPNQVPAYTVREWPPFEAVNRGVFVFNNAVNYCITHPVGYVWNTVLPTPVRESVNNFSANFNTPFSALQNLLQGKPRDAGTEMYRFVVNTTAGVLGLFDVADCPAKHQSLPNTLGVWGLGPITHGEFPVIVQTTNVRDFGGSLGESAFKGLCTFGVSTVVNIVTYVNNAEMLADHRQWTIDDNPSDPYAAVRDRYESKREQKIQDALVR